MKLKELQPPPMVTPVMHISPTAGRYVAGGTRHVSIANDATVP